MTTLEKLQAHLATEVTYVTSTVKYKTVAPRVECADGARISVQASETHYSTPRSNTGPYTHVEAWCASTEVTEFEYSDDEPSAQVPIEDVVQFIDNHGGFKESTWE